MKTKPFVRQINYYETDQMAIVHHSNYIRWFEEARLDYMKQLDLDYRELENMGIIIPVLSVDCRYRKPLRFGDEAVIRVAMTRYDGVKMEFRYEITDPTGQILYTTGHTGHCLLDRDMKPIRMKRAFPELYTRLKEAVEA